jgi:hypothetical protein
MRKRNKAFVLIVGLLLPIAGLCQSMGYMDADSAEEAAGMIYSTTLSSRIMRENCGAKFPDLVERFDADLGAWQKAEASIIAKSDRMMREARALNPKEFEVNMTALEGMFTKALTAMSEMPGEAGTRVYRQACTNHFSALAAGAWRERTPKAYKFLDEMP